MKLYIFLQKRNFFNLQSKNEIIIYFQQLKNCSNSAIVLLRKINSKRYK